MKNKLDKMIRKMPKETLESILSFKRTQKKSKDFSDIVSLLREELIDINRLHEYKYLMEVAKNLNWSVGRLNKIVDTMNLKELANFIKENPLPEVKEETEEKIDESSM